MMSYWTLLAVHCVLGAEICANDQCANKIVKEEAVMMLQEASRRTGLKATIVEQQKEALSNQQGRVESINRLMESTSKMLRSGVTPDVASFAESTIKTLVDEAEPALAHAHRATEELLANEFSAFNNFTTERDVTKGHIVALAKNETDSGTIHNDCRASQEEEYEISQQCNITLQDLWKVVKEKELLMETSDSEISDTWCGETLGEISEDLFDENVQYFDRYIKHEKEAADAWAEYNGKMPVCQQQATDYWSQKDVCDAAQVVLESRSCIRASAVHNANTRSQTEWADLVAAYEAAVNSSEKMADDRNKEYAGIQIVKCLLENIHNNSNMGEPCDETSHPDLVHGQISSCHSKADKTTLYSISPAPVPATPEEIGLDPFPCGDNYLTRYDSLPANAQAQQCQSNACSEELKDAVVSLPVQ